MPPKSKSPVKAKAKLAPPKPKNQLKKSPQPTKNTTKPQKPKKAPAPPLKTKPVQGQKGNTKQRPNPPRNIARPEAATKSFRPPPAQNVYQPQPAQSSARPLHYLPGTYQQQPTPSSRALPSAYQQPAPPHGIPPQPQPTRSQANVLSQAQSKNQFGNLPPVKTKRSTASSAGSGNSGPKKKCKPVEENTIAPRPQTYGYAEDETEEEEMAWGPFATSGEDYPQDTQDPCNDEVLVFSPTGLATSPLMDEETEEEETLQNTDQGMLDKTIIAKPAAAEVTQSKPPLTRSEISKIARIARNTTLYAKKSRHRLPGSHPEGLARYTRVFDTQVEDGYQPEKSASNQFAWNAGFVVKVLLVLSAIHLYQFAVCAFPLIRNTVVQVMFLHIDWIVAVPGALVILMSVCSGMSEWGKSYPTNILTLLAHILLWTTIWLTLSFTWPDVIPYIVEDVGSCCLLMAALCRLWPKFELHKSSMYLLAGLIAFIHLTAVACISFLGFMKHLTTPEKWETIVSRLVISNVIGGFIFLYICFDIHEMLVGNRPVAWPTQWLYGVNLVCQDFVWICMEGLKLALYLLPCTYCKDAKNTIWKRWTCCRYNYRVKGRV